MRPRKPPTSPGYPGVWETHRLEGYLKVLGRSSSEAPFTRMTLFVFLMLDVPTVPSQFLLVTIPDPRVSSSGDDIAFLAYVVRCEALCCSCIP